MEKVFFEFPWVYFFLVYFFSYNACHPPIKDCSTTMTKKNSNQFHEVQTMNMLQVYRKHTEIPCKISQILRVLSFLCNPSKVVEFLRDLLSIWAFHQTIEL